MVSNVTVKGVYFHKAYNLAWGRFCIIFS